MASILRTIKDKVLTPEMTKTYNGVRNAEVVFSDNITNTASILIDDLSSSGKIVLKNVPIQIQSYGLHTIGLSEGDKVWVSFTNNSPLLPKIIGIADNDTYQSTTKSNLKHLTTGALDIVITDTENTCTNMCEDLIDLGNTKIVKYLDFKNFNVESHASDFIASLGYYQNDEIGLTNPYNNSTIKISNNGCITVYMNGNQGIRIDPNNSSININCTDKIKITCNELDINSSTIKINGDETNGL